MSYYVDLLVHIEGEQPHHLTSGGREEGFLIHIDYQESQGAISPFILAAQTTGAKGCHDGPIIKVQL